MTDAEIARRAACAMLAFEAYAATNVNRSKRTGNGWRLCDRFGGPTAEQVIADAVPGEDWRRRCWLAALACDAARELRGGRLPSVEGARREIARRNGEAAA